MSTCYYYKYRFFCFIFFRIIFSIYIFKYCLFFGCFSNRYNEYPQKCHKELEVRWRATFDQPGPPLSRPLERAEFLLIARVLRQVDTNCLHHWLELFQPVHLISMFSCCLVASLSVLYSLNTSNPKSRTNTNRHILDWAR